MHLTLRMNMDNAAFEMYPASEAARLLRLVAEKMENGADGGKLLDINGNTVGTWSVRGGKAEEQEH